MADVFNPLLSRVLHRRRMLRFARLSAAGWAFFGGLHIVFWWAAFERPTVGQLHGALSPTVWPLLLAATACFVALLIFTARWILAPDPLESDWQSVASPMSPDPIEATLLDRATASAES
jgi:hypothetical protein